jgi:prepilin-type N-terminal cleavage/methylation domain-containing protein
MRKSTNKTGFTLIEMLVAVFVFSIIMTIATGAIFSIVSANKTSQALKSVMDNLSSALDSMSREVRYGSKYNCGEVGGSCPNGTTDKSFRFENKDGQNVTYSFSQESIFRTVGSYDPVRLTAPEVHVEDLNFYVTGVESNGDEPTQPLLLITISGYAKAGAGQANFDIQTMVSQRGSVCKDIVHEYLTGEPSCPLN